jgi:hypothetical protein
MLHAYNTLLKQMEEKQAGELKPEKKIEEKKTKEAVQVAESLTTQLEAAYQKVQDIALKTVEGASNSKSVASLQQLLGEQMRKQTAEK